MELVRPNFKNKKRKGRGPGSGKGKTSGRGHKGLKSRSGGKSKLGFEGGQMPLYRRIPKRGFTSIYKKEYQIVNVKKLDEIFKDNSTVNKKTLKEKGLIKSLKKPVKILGNGELNKALKISADTFSKNALGKIKKAGGEVVEK